MDLSISTPLPPPTQYQAVREQIALEIGCIACLRNGRPQTRAHIFPLAIEGKSSHWHTVALCRWHGWGIVPEGMSEILCRKRRGPSRAKQPGLFQKRFGTDAELLERQNRRVRRYCLRLGMTWHLVKLRVQA